MLNWLVANRYKSLSAAALVAFVFALSLIVFQLFDTLLPPDDPPDRAFDTSRDQIFKIAVSRIAAESKGSLPKPVVEAAPGVLRDQASSAPEVTSLTAPAGYSFVEHHGAMTRARIEEPRPPMEEEPDGPGWLVSPNAIATLTEQAAAAGRDWSFGWIRIATDSTRDDLARSLEGTGAEVVGTAGRMVRAKLPGSTARLRTIAALPEIDGMGATPAATKLLAFEDDPLDWTVNEQRPAYITLMADDEDGQWRRALEDLGAVVGRYDPDVRVYAANVSPDILSALAAADFVLSVEPIGIVQALHDTAVPAMGADAVRTYDGAPGIFAGTGGASVPIAVMDTGLNINHLDIASHRDSICGTNFAYNSGWFGPDGSLIEAEDLWIDEGRHGTHVTGTIAGNGYLDSRFAGIAPAVRHIRFAKVLDSYGFGFDDSVPRGMDYLARTSGCSEKGKMSPRVKPLIVNMSLAGALRIFEGRDVGARKLDATVWGHRQLYVVAQSNKDIHGFSNYGAAKNSLAVGATLDSGEPASFTSHGPTADGRLAPNVVATGVRVHSTLGRGSRGGYVAFSGTSMASPATAGVAALLMDSAPAYKEHPALTRARLMASAILPDLWLADVAAFPSNNSDGPGTLQAVYGMGKASARTAALDRDQPDGWAGGSATAELEDGEYAYQDIEVPEGASRLDLVMTWDEPPAEAIASTVLNDLDLWLDRDADCEMQACGEHASQSRVDNVEWIIVRNPEPGTYRVKVLAHRVYTAAPRAAIAWTVIRGASTPKLGISADQEHLAEEGKHELTLTLTSDSYVAAGTRLHIDCRDAEESFGCSQVTLEKMALAREDGISVDMFNEPGLSRPINLGASVPVGEVAVGTSREITFVVSIDSNPGNAQLHFRANAWNAHAASVAVGVGSGNNIEPVFDKPANDDYSDAEAIDGDEGSRTLDLLHATPEPGEPVFSPREGRPAGSVWYEWTASNTAAVEFAILPHDSSSHAERNDLIDIFMGDRVTALESVVSGSSSVTFFPDEGTVYHIRVSGLSRGTAMDLRWSPGSRPANDDFAHAALLEGESGEFEGSSAGATLEPGESFGTVAATTWFRWTAPDDGDWNFFVQYPTRGQVLVFEGDSIDALRLVSRYPSSSATLPVRGGSEYRIALAFPNLSTGPYTLTWRLRTDQNRGNDLFADAEVIGNESSSEVIVDIDTESTVEPDEPQETGVRTAWWVWEAPADSLYTWRLEDSGEVVPTYPKMQLTMFTGTTIEDLELVAETGPGAPFDFHLDAVAEQRYWIAAGFPTGDVTAYQQSYASGRLVWGLTPVNDETAGATELSGISGSFSGSNEFATTGRGQRTDTMGRSSLWWTYEATASGWVRFAVDEEAPWVITIHRNASDGFGGLEIAASSRWQRVDGEVLFEAVEGVRYTISLGIRGGGRGGEFTLRWEEADDPGWLRYAGRLADGDRDSDGKPVEIRGPGDLVFNESGDVLYLASDIGLQVFKRNPANGELDHVQLLESDLDLNRAPLIWDPHRERLLADDCGTWRSFAPVGEGSEVEDRGELDVADDPGTCADQLLLSADGNHVYRIGGSNLELFAIEDAGNLRFVENYNLGNTQVRAVLSHNGDHLYTVSPWKLRVFERNLDSGMLTMADFEWIPLPRIQPLAISDDDAWLFVFDGEGEQTNVFSLKDPLNPELLATLSRFWEATYKSIFCIFADVRSEVRTDGGVAVDVVCPGLIFSPLWNPTTSELFGADFFTDALSDRFNSPPMPNAVPEDMAVSPDDRHLYVSTSDHGILIFDRDGNSVGETDGQESGSPDLVIQSVRASAASVVSGESFKLNAVVRNRGDGASAATSLHFYRSGNATISTADTQVGSVTLDSLAPYDTSGRFLDLAAPSQTDTYYYGACIDEVADESDTTNNCSAAITIIVTNVDGNSRTEYEVGQTITTLPTGIWSPELLSNVSFTSMDDVVVIEFDNGGIVEKGDYRYTCENIGGCEINDRVVNTGKIVETSI